MPDFEKMYFTLAGGVADAIDDLQLAGNRPELVIRHLQQALRQGEEQYMAQGKKPPEE